MIKKVKLRDMTYLQFIKYCRRKKKRVKGAFLIIVVD